LLGDLDETNKSVEWMISEFKVTEHTHRAKIQSLFAHLEMSKGNYIQCLDYIERVVEILPKIHFANMRVLIPVLISCVALYSVYENVKKKANKAKSTIGKQFNSVHNDLGVQHENSDVDSLSERRRSTTNTSVMSRAATPTNLRSGTSRRASDTRTGTLSRKISTDQHKIDYVVKHIRGPDGKITFDYRKTTTIGGASNTKSTSEIINTRIRAICQSMMSEVSRFHNMTLAQPFLLLLGALARVCDSSVVPNTTGDGPHALRAWFQEWKKQNTGDMKLVAALVAIKTWTASNEDLDYTGDLNVGMSLLAELGLDGLCIF
jgi:hypothetical protein